MRWHDDHPVPSRYRQMPVMESEMAPRTPGWDDDDLMLDRDADENDATLPWVAGLTQRGYHGHDHQRRSRAASPVWRQRRVLGGAAAALVILAAAVLAIGPARLFVHATTPTATPTVSGTTAAPTSGMPYPANIDFEAGSPNAPGKYTASALSAPGIGAVTVQLNWDAMETSPGVFNWAPVDKEVADWASRGKQFILIVRLQGGTSCTGRQVLPAWEIARVPHLCAAYPGDIIPDYFDPTYTADSHAYIQAIGQHFAQSPYRSHLAYVRIAKGRGGENMPIKGGPSDPAWAQLQRWGLTPDTLKQYHEQRLLFEQSLFPYTHVIYNVDPLGVQDPATGQPLQQVIAEFAAAHGMGVGYNGLRPGSSGGIGRSSLAQKYPNTYITFQTVFSVGSLSAIQGDITTASGAGGRAIEWYTGDATNPAYQSAFQQWQSTVDTKYCDLRPVPTTSPVTTPSTTPITTPSATTPPAATAPATSGDPTPAPTTPPSGDTAAPPAATATTTAAGSGLQPANSKTVTGVPCVIVINGRAQRGTCSGTFTPAQPSASTHAGDDD